MHNTIKRIQADIQQGIPLSASLVHELPALLPDCLIDLMALARLQASCFANSPFTCGISNAKSGNCSENCSFCAQSQYHATHAPVYQRVSCDVLQKKASTLAAANATYMGIVTSGKSPTPYDLDYFCNVVAQLSRNTDIKFCASFGIITSEQALALRQAGFSCYHHNLESSRSFFPSICTTHSYESRIATIKNARSAGLRICSGGIFGMGESWSQRIELALTLKKLAVDSIPLNFLFAIKGTPLENRSPMPPQEALGIIALMRLVHPTADITVCGGRKSILGDWEKLVFSAGANGLMTGDYLTTTGGTMEQDRALMHTLGVLA